MEGDDLDFFVVVRSGAVASFLFVTYASLRLERLRRGRPEDPPACFNYVVDERRASRDFAEGRGLLFAREALSAQMIFGDSFYRGLLAQSPSLRGELPRLYAARTKDPGDVAPRGAPVWVRLMSALLFVPLAGYLQMVGFHRNAVARKEHRSQDEFRTLATPDRVVFQSRRFEQLRALYEGQPPASPGAGGSPTPSRMTAAR